MACPEGQNPVELLSTQVAAIACVVESGSSSPSPAKPSQAKPSCPAAAHTSCSTAPLRLHPVGPSVNILSNAAKSPADSSASGSQGSWKAKMYHNLWVKEGRGQQQSAWTISQGGSAVGTPTRATSSWQVGTFVVHACNAEWHVQGRQCSLLLSTCTAVSTACLSQSASAYLWQPSLPGFTCSSFNNFHFLPQLRPLIPPPTHLLS